mgnify:CR=1 FL=1
MRASATSFLDSETCNKGNSQVSSLIQATTRKMSQVQNTEDSIKHVMWLVHPLLSAIGAWPTNVTSSVLSKMLRWVLIFSIYSVQLAVIIPSLLYIILIVRSRKWMKVILPHLNSLYQVCKYTIVLWRHNEIRQLFDDLRNDCFNASEEDQWIYKTRSTIGHRLMISFMILLYTGGTGLRAITPFLRGKIILPDNTTIRPLPSPGYFVFFNEQLTPNYEIIFFVQVFCGFVNYTILSGTLGLCTMLCLHMCSMLRILGNKMKEFSNLSETDEDTVQKKITDIVEYHTKIKR